MIQWFSVFGLIVLILVSVENKSVLHHELQSKPMNINSNHSIINIKTTFLNTKYTKLDSKTHNLNTTTKLNDVNNPQMNHIVPVSKLFKGKELVDIFKKSRFPRNVKQTSDKNNKNNILRQPIRVVLDLNPRNEKDYYDYYNNEKYYDEYQEKKINSMVDDWNLNREIEINSKPITKTLSESQERKRCTYLKSIHNLEPEKVQHSQKLLSENIQGGIIPKLRCRDCKVLNSNTNLEEPKINESKSSNLKQVNDDYFINIVNQLIDKLNKQHSTKSKNEKNLRLQKSNEPDLLENKSANEEISNSSSSEEWIFKLQKMKGNRIIDKLNSSPEDIFVNGKWIKNNIANNKNVEVKPAVNELIEPSNKNESNSKSDTKYYNLINPENQINDTYDNSSENSKNGQIAISTQHNMLDNPTSPIPERDKHFLASKETNEPLQLLTSTPKDNLYSTTINENNILKLTTSNLKKNNFSHNDDNNENQDKSFESTLNNFQTTLNFESNEQTTPESNISLNNKSLDRILESEIKTNDNYNSKTNHSDESTNVEDSSSIEKDSNLLKNNCICNKKVIKNILSSTVISNITEIKTDTYRSPTNIKTKSHKRSDKLLNEKTNKLTTNQSKTTLKEPKLNVLQKAKSIIVNIQPQKTISNNNKERGRTKTFSTNVLSKGAIPNLQFKEPKLKDQRNNNHGKKLISKVDEIENKITPKASLQTSSKQYATKLKQLNNYISPQNLNTQVGEKIKKLNTNNKITRNKSIDLAKHAENNVKNVPSKIISKLKLNSPINSKTDRNEYPYFNDFTPVKKVFSTSKNVLQKPKKINQPSSVNYIRHNNDNIAQKSPRKLIKKLHEYDLTDQNTQTIKTHKGNVNKKIKVSSQKSSLDKNNFDLVKLRNPQSSVKNVSKPKIQITPTNKNILNVDSKINDMGSTNNNNQFVDNKNRLKPKKLINDENTILGSMPSKNKYIPINLYDDDILKKPRLSSKQNKNQNNLQSSIKSDLNEKTDQQSNLKTKMKPNSNILSKYKLPKAPQEKELVDLEHAPYNAEDLVPITFAESSEKSMLSDTNSRFDTPYPISWRSFSENQPNNVANLKPLKPVEIISPGPEYEDDYETWKTNEDERKKKHDKNQLELNSNNHGLLNGDVSGYAENDSENVKEKSKNQSIYGILPQLKIIDGVFKVPLVGHTSFDINGSAYVSDILVPIENSNGQHSAISLTKLLTGNFHLSNEHGKDSLDLEPRAEINSTLSSTWIPIKNTSSDVTENDSKVFNSLLVTNGCKKQITPIHLIQIINNGMCPVTYNDTGKILKSENNGKANLKNVQNEDQKVSSIKQSQSVPNNKQVNRRLENAYNHFDSEILNKFLQVYNPSHII